MQPDSHLAFLVLLLVAAVEVIDSAKPATCTAEYQGYTENIHTMCLTDPPGAVELTLTQEEKDAAVNRHNEIRADVTPTATNMRKMVWDDDLAKVAAKWARQCSLKHDKNRSQPELKKYNGFVGQNWVAGVSSLVDGINFWYDELPLWVFGEWSLATGHYIQIVFHGASRVGCGHAKCKRINYYVCNYFTGVYGGQDPYEQGAPCGKCPDSCDKSGKLCDCGGKQCTNGGTLDLNTCKCQCPRLWTGDECETMECPTKDFVEWCSYPTFYPERSCPNAELNGFAKVCPIRCGICPKPVEPVQPTKPAESTTPTDPCHGTLCEHNGRLNKATCKCTCPPGISGDRCEICPIRDNEEWCSYPTFYPDEDCPKGTNTWYAKQCPIRCGICPKPCPGTVCEHYGEVNPDTCKCICPLGLSGDLCETCPTEDNEAWCSYPTFYPEKSCPNGENNWYTKQCPIRCGVCPSPNNDPCDPNPCQNGGTCDAGTCDCTGTGFTGATCAAREVTGEVNDPCDPNPCQNGGTCDAGVCDCTGTGFNGATCADPDAAATCAAGWTKSNSACYKFVDVKKTFADAEAKCAQDMDSVLTPIQSKAERDFVRKLAGETIWIGGDKKDTADFQWSDGTPVADGYTSWKSGEPDGAAETPPDQNCIIMNRGGKWMDFTCSERKKPYVCKYLLA